MIKKLLLILPFVVLSASAYAKHIRGGELYYEYLGPGTAPNSSRYMITLKLYIDCNANQPGQLETEEKITIFQKPSYTEYGSGLNMPLTKETWINYDPNSNPCISYPPTDICYRLRFFTATIELPDQAQGYTLTFQRCCRVDNIRNISGNSSDDGATYTCDIPGTAVLAGAQKNSSPIITGNDAVAICAGTYFTFDFSATDADKDSLVYMLCSAYNGGGQNGGGNCYTCPTPDPAAPPPYNPLPYASGFSGTQPMGSTVSIDPHTGLLSGIAPTRTGQYVVTACIAEYRNGVLINVHRKDIHLEISDCIPLKAVLQPSYSFCDDFLVTFRNEQVNPSGSVYIWTFGDGSPADTSTDASGFGMIQHQYAIAGTYPVKVKVILAGQCQDSTTTLAKVYPGFFPDFKANGACLYVPIQFADMTKTNYGTVSYWSWDFGDETTSADTSHLKNPAWKYSTIGSKQVVFIVGSSNGCLDTVYRSVPVLDKPPIDMPFRDTLICSIDTLQLHAAGSGTFTWTPAYNILGANTADPYVFPKTTTTYHINLFQSGCISNDSVRVRVVDFVTLDAGNDTTICLTDPVTLRPASDGLQYEWTPAATLDDPNAKNPVATPVDASTNYQVTAHIGKCSATDNLTVRTAPYPQANAGADTVICFADTATLHGQTDGSTFIWNPTGSLSDPKSLTTEAWPVTTQAYTLSAYDTLGCPKPGIDRVIVTVRPEIKAFAGNDTAVVVDQPLQLNGSGAEFFEWTPPDYLSNPNISNPMAVLDGTVGTMTYQMKAYTLEGCYDLDSINIRIFKTKPDIFVPNAFVPGGSQNNVLRPIPVGISELYYFRVYNRWGQLVFQTSQTGKGWDGTLGGKPQSSGTYVWMVSGKDYTGRVVTKKGTATLLR